MVNEIGFTQLTATNFPSISVIWGKVLFYFSAPLSAVFQQSFLSPMGPPLQTSVPKSQHKASSLGKKYQEAMEREKQIREEVSTFLVLHSDGQFSNHRHYVENRFGSFGLSMA